MAKDRKQPQDCGLNNVFWERVSASLRSQGRDLPDLWKTLGRNKNTYTNWIRKRTIPKLSDVQEVATALGLWASELLRLPSEGGADGLPISDQLELPFAVESKCVRMEVQYNTTGLVLKRLGKAG
jgi:hypothetical protein